MEPKNQETLGSYAPSSSEFSEVSNECAASDSSPLIDRKVSEVSPTGEPLELLAADQTHSAEEHAAAPTGGNAEKPLGGCKIRCPTTVLEELQELAKSRGGCCLSTAYVNNYGLLSWECAYGHTWDAPANNVKNHNSWCPHCVFNVGEELVRATLIEAFPGKTFDRTRREPWMGGLELDGFNEELRLAFEYQGKQHYEHVDMFHGKNDKYGLESQQARDLETKIRCEGAFMTLLIIPYTIKFPDIRTFVRNELLSLGYDIAPVVGSDTEFYDRLRATNPARVKQYERAVSVITKKGGKCLSAQYVGYRVPLRIQCRFGHVFEATLEAIDQPADRGPRFCPECGGTRKKEDEVLASAVESCGFSFLGVESRQMGDRKRRFIRVKCPQSHEYEVLWDNFKPTNGVPRKGCTKCHHQKLGASKRADITNWCKTNSIVAVTEYTSVAKPCTWRCSRGHEFTATMASLRQREKPCTVCWLSDFSSDHSLQCLTPWTQKCTPTTPLKWRCMCCDVEFSASVINLGCKTSFCPKCD